MIEIQNLCKKYGNLQAINKLNLKIEKGEIVGFLGPNGAGKTTTMNIITGYIPASDGIVRICGYDVMEEPKEVKKCVGYLPEKLPVYQDMSVYDYLKFVSQLKLVQKKNIKSHLQQIMEIVRIEDVQKRVIKNLSRGYKQRVGLAQALVGDPEVLVLDEPTVGLDPNQIIEIRKLIQNLGNDRTIVLSSHTLPEVSVICQRVIIINKGEIVAQDTLDNLSRNIGIHSKYSIKISGNKDTIVKALSDIEGIKQITLTRKVDANINDYLIETHHAIDVRESVFYTLAEIRCPILELKALDSSLEEIFVQLTNEEGRS